MRNSISRARHWSSNLSTFLKESVNQRLKPAEVVSIGGINHAGEYVALSERTRRLVRPKKGSQQLEGATATVVGNGKQRQSWLKRSLRTKHKQEAKRLAPPVLMEFDRILADAEALIAERPLRRRSTAARSNVLRISSTPMSLHLTKRLAARVETRRCSKACHYNWLRPG